MSVVFYKHSAKTTRPLPSSKCSVVYVIISESPETRLVAISVRAISMHKIESREISNRKYLSKTIRSRQAKKTDLRSLLAYVLKRRQTTVKQRKLLPYIYSPQKESIHLLNVRFLINVLQHWYRMAYVISNNISI